MEREEHVKSKFGFKLEIYEVALLEMRLAHKRQMD
jgi:hypothetical protein